jgi:hypothetical protein
VLEIAQLEGLPEAAWKLANRLIRCVKSKKVEIDLRVSLGDDYDTGMLFGLLLPVKLYLELPPAYDINIQPAFEEDLLLDGSVFGSWQARPIAVMFPCLAFACSRAAWRAGMKMIGYRCSSKN